MPNKTILLVDDDQAFIEPLNDALTYEGFRVLTARSVEQALAILATVPVDLATVDIMLDPGESLQATVKTQTAGIYLCKEIRSRYPTLDVFCISVVSDPETIAPIKRLGIRILTKGQITLRSVLDILRARLTGIAYSTDHRPKHKDW